MSEKERNFKLEKDISDLRHILNSGEDIKLPNSLKSENLLHLLPAIEQKTPINIVKWLLLKKAIPVYTSIVAALLLIIIWPRVNVLPNNIAAVSEKNESTMSDREMVADSLLVYNAEVTQEAADEMGGEDLSMYYEDEVIEENIPLYTIKVDDNTADNGVPNNSSPKVSNGQLEDTEEATESLPADAPMMSRAFGGGGGSYSLSGDWQGYSLLWRASDPNNSEEKGYPIILAILNDETGDVYLQQGLSDFLDISAISVRNNTVYILGTGEKGILVSSYTGIASGKLNYKKTQEIDGNLFTFFEKDNYLYILSLIDSDTNLFANGIHLEDSAEKGITLVSVLDTNSGNFRQTPVIGTSRDITINDLTIKFGYKTSSGGLEVSEVLLNQQNIYLN